MPVEYMRVPIIGLGVPVPLVAVMWVALVVYVTLVLMAHSHEGPELRALANHLKENCYDFTGAGSYWSYRWCLEHGVTQYHMISKNSFNENTMPLRRIDGDDPLKYVYSSSKPAEGCTGPKKMRTATVELICCGNQPNMESTFIMSVMEERDTTCTYLLSVCHAPVCAFQGPAAEVQLMETVGVRRERIPMPDDGYAPSLSDVTEEIRYTDTSETTRRTTRRSRSASSKTTSPPLPHHQFNQQRQHASPQQQQPQSVIIRTPSLSEVSDEEQIELRERVRSMFIRNYDAYMKHAFPKGDLAPISCKGQSFELIKIPAVTLIDTLDSLVVLGNYTEFRNAVKKVESVLMQKKFDYDINVSVFETTIRILGGLLSAHLLAIDESLQLYCPSKRLASDCEQYSGSLLVLATDLGNRLLPAFDTTTGIPYGTVNLRRGVPHGETTVSSTAGAGSLLLEFEALSRATGDPKYGEAAKTAVEAMMDQRSSIGLLGKHINIKTGKWTETASGVGSNSDSFYEYLIKCYELFHTANFERYFTETFVAVKHFNQLGDWFSDVEMSSGGSRRLLAENLQAFWPGMESTLGMTRSSARMLNALHEISFEFGFMPEEFDYDKWTVAQQSNQKANLFKSDYLLRPELIESTYLQYRSTHDRSWLIPARHFLESLETYTSTACGNAIVKNVATMELEDSLPSYFLAETCKYLYLLFDEQNFVHEKPIVFSTEAHLFDSVVLNSLHSAHNFSNPAKLLSEIHENSLKRGPQQHTYASPYVMRAHESLGKCPKKNWWERETGFVPEFNDILVPSIGKLLMDTPLPFHMENSNMDEFFAPSSYVPSFDVSRDYESEYRRCGLDQEYVDFTDADDASKGENGMAARNIDESDISYEDLRPDRSKVMNSITFPSTGEGDFLVDVYASGFSVLSKKYGNVLNIFHIDDAFVTSTEISPLGDIDMDSQEARREMWEGALKKSESEEIAICPLNVKHMSIAAVTGHTYRCSIDVVNTVPVQVDALFSSEPSHKDIEDYSEYIDPEPIDISISNEARDKLLRFEAQSVEIDSFNDVVLTEPFTLSDISPFSEDLLSSIPCAVASFGKTVATSANDPTRFVAEFVRAIGDPQGCAEPSKSDYLEAYGPMPYEGKIVLINRGGCSFEEKAWNAQVLGAAAAVILNHEETVTTMGGSGISAFTSNEDVFINNDALAMLKQAMSGSGVMVDSEGIDFVWDGTQQQQSAVGNAEGQMDVSSSVAPSSSSSSGFMDVMQTMKLSLEGLTSSAISKLTSIIGRSQKKKVVIPAVMISKQHGARLLRLIDHLENKGGYPQLLLDTHVVPSALDNVFNEGNTDTTAHTQRSVLCDGTTPGTTSRLTNRYPKVIASSKSIRIVSSKPWGVVVAKNAQNLWELRIFGRGDVDALLVREATFESTDGSKILGSYIQHITTNMGELYSLLINRQCSPEVDPGDSKVVIKKRQ